MFRTVLLAIVTVALASACTWVKLEPAGQSIRVAREGEDLGYCDLRGEITVTVKHNVGFIERNALKVRDELETMARNEASDMAADTVQAIDEPLYGEQRFKAFACRNRSASATPAQPAAPDARSDDGAETFPLKGD